MIFLNYLKKNKLIIFLNYKKKLKNKNKLKTNLIKLNY